MRIGRLTLAGSMGMIALAAIGMGALRSPSLLGASLIFTLAVGILLAAAVAALSLPGRARAVCGSFALIGSIYLGLGLGPWSESAAGPHLLTSPIIDYAYMMVTGQTGVLEFGSRQHMYEIKFYQLPGFWNEPQRPIPIDSRPGSPIWRLMNYAGSIRLAPWPVYRIAHSLLGIVAGSTGALVAGHLTRPRAAGGGRPADPIPIPGEGTGR